MLKGINIRRGMAWGIIIIGALLAFEIFNYSTTQFALADVLGSLPQRFWGGAATGFLLRESREIPEFRGLDKKEYLFYTVAK